MNSPLKSPITNNKSTSTIKKLIPPGSIVHSFLYLDGNIEVALASSKRFVIGHTNKYVNYEFWKCLLDDPQRLSMIAEHFSPIESENIFDVLQKGWFKYPDPFVRSALYYLLNQSSDTSFISMGKLIENLNLNFQLNKLKNFTITNLHIELDKEKDFIESIKNINDNCDYVFIPIGVFTLNLLDEGKSIGFEQNLINHTDVRELLEESDKKIILLYKYSKSVVSFYKDQNKYIIDKWGRLTENTKFAKEVLIANF